MIYTINNAFVGMFEEKLTKFVKKFDKYGESTLEYTKSAPYKRDEELVVDISVEGSYQISGYEFVASLEYVNEKNCNLVKKISSDVNVPDIYRTRTECDHCKVNRFRKYTVLLKNTETGEYVQVGKSCVQDFFGVDIAMYASYLSLWNTLEEYENRLHNSTRHKELVWDVKDVIEQTLEQVARHGYISKNTSFETGADSTSRIVFSAMRHVVGEGGLPLYEEYEISDGSKKQAEIVIDYINKYGTTDNDYAFNLQTLISLPYVDCKNFGLVVSSVGFYLREIHKDEERKAKASLPASNYIGSVGDKVQFTAIPTCMYSADTEFGWIYIYKFLVNNDEVIWKTSKSLESVDMTVKATVKETSEYKGTKQTVITRGRVVD